jgi:hypothetical protein
MQDVGKFYGLFYGHLVYFVAILNIVWLFGIYFPVLICCAKRNLANPGLLPQAGYVRLVTLHR